MYQAHEYERRILLCVVGASPQIITETLYVLAVEEQPRFIPTEIHLVTTTFGAEMSKQALIERGHLNRLCADYDLDRSQILFNDSTIHLVTDAQGQVLQDIRCKQDNNDIADTIVRVVAQLTSQANTAVHASISGGRRTMTFFMGYIMSLFGREQDRASHVLINHNGMESREDFYYPPKQEQLLPLGNRLISSNEIKVSLADLTFVRLREYLGEDLLAVDRLSYREIVARAQSDMGSAKLVLDYEDCSIECSGIAVRISPLQFAILSLLSLHVARGSCGLLRQELSEEDKKLFKDCYQDLPRSKSVVGVVVNSKVLEREISKLNKRLRKELGVGRAKPYLVQSVAPKVDHYYRLDLKPQQIEHRKNRKF